MTMAQKTTGPLQEWILIEAYKNGLALGIFFVHRHDIYRRYFDLTADSLGLDEATILSIGRPQEVRLKSAALLCQSVKQLLKHGLIQFNQDPWPQGAPPGGSGVPAASIHLTEAGIKKAELLFMELQAFTSPDRLERLCPARYPTGV
jgi:hypothetical protein